MAQLLKVQQAALSSSKGHRGFAYWMEMGLGKTLTALTEFVQLAEAKEATRLVVICPNSFKSGWRDEIIKQGIDVDPWVYESGGNNEHFLRKKFERPPVLIVNYEAIRRDGCIDFVDKFVNKRKAMLVLDESIQIKTNNSKQTKAVLSIAPWFEYVRLLSGKPMTQGPHDLWAQLRAMGQIKNMNFWVFRNNFCRMGGYMQKKVVGAQNAEWLGQLVDPHVFRATKSQWTDLPPKIYTIREVQMTGDQEYQYKTMEKEFITWLTDTEYVTVDMAITKFIKLAQIQFGFIIDEGKELHELIAADKNPRIQMVKDILDDEIQGKLVVVYHHRYSGEILANELRDYGYAYIRGGMTPEELTDQRTAFNEDPDCRVIGIQTTAGRYGHTLLGGPEPENQCSTMLFIENTWSLDTRSQLEDRIHRIGQVGESCLYIDVSSSSLDRRIIGALQHKQSIFDAVMAHIKS